MTSLQIQPHSTTVRPTYQVKFRHVNCRKTFRAEDPQRCIIVCSSWTPNPVLHYPHPPHVYPSSDSLEPKRWTKCYCGCEYYLRRDWVGTGPELVRIDSTTIAANSDPAIDIPELIQPFVVLGALAQNLWFQGCRKTEKYKLNEGVREITAFIVWEGEPPRDPQGRAHECNITSSHLDIMRQRECGDYIQVDFITYHPGDESTRRKGMLRALAKLARKASSHCNR